MNNIPELSPGARRVMMHAKRVAQDHHHDFITTEHILLCILESKRPTKSVQIMMDLDVDVEEFKSFVISSLGKYKGPKKPELKDIEPSGRVLKMLGYASQIANEMSTTTVRVDHILMSILVSDAGSGNNLFRLKNIDINFLYENIYVEIEPKRRKTKKVDDTTVVGGEDAYEEEADVTNNPLEKYALNLTRMAANGELDPVIGRDVETTQTIQTLSRRIKSNPVLVGEPGVGKTAIVEHLAHRIAIGDVPVNLRNMNLWSLDLAQLVAGTMYRGQFEERIKEVMRYVESRDDVILFIDELHMLVGAGSANGSMDASNLLKPALSRGKIKCVGATTFQEYKECIEGDGALERRFQTITVDEPCVQDTVDILKGIKSKYEQYHNVRYSNKIIEQVVSRCDRYLPDKRFPDKAIDIMDELGAQARVKSYTSYDQFTVIHHELISCVEKKNRYVERKEFARALNCRGDENLLIQKLENMQNEDQVELYRINADDVDQLISSKSGVPVNNMSRDESSRLKQLNRSITTRVIGQQNGVNKICNAIKRNRSGVSNPNKPVCSLLCLGPTGVGKTHLARTLGEMLFDNNNFKQFDMSEYTEKHTVSKMIGSPPGYVGYGEGGALTEYVRHTPYCVLLFDEIEKAHPEVLQLFLQVMEYGVLTDSEGLEVNFKNTIVIMTSNIGSHKFFKQDSVGFGAQQSTEQAVMGELKKSYTPEFINRIDEVIVFDMLQQRHMLEIASNLLRELKRNLKQTTGKIINFDNTVKQMLVDSCDNQEYGARPLRRLITQHVETPLADWLIDNPDTRKMSVSILEQRVIVTHVA